MQALLLIFFSEIGDKTFFIALLLALQQPRSVVFTGAPRPAQWRGTLAGCRSRAGFAASSCTRACSFSRCLLATATARMAVARPMHATCRLDWPRCVCTAHAGTFGALAVMTVVSVGLGRVLHLIDEVGVNNQNCLGQETVRVRLGQACPYQWRAGRNVPMRVRRRRSTGHELTLPSAMYCFQIVCITLLQRFPRPAGGAQLCCPPLHDIPAAVWLKAVQPTTG